MFILLSPAKRLHSTSVIDVAMTAPAHATMTETLVNTLQQHDVFALMTLMNISHSLAETNAKRYAAFADTPAQPALGIFAGDAYQALDAGSLSADDLAFAAPRLGILSGLYGMLRLSDGIKPYRLEMGARLAVGTAASLYLFWREAIAATLADRAGDHTIINLASQEYFQAIDSTQVPQRIITIDCKEVDENGVARAIGMVAKRARGAFARHIITHRLDTPTALRDVVINGYRFNAADSSETRWAFHRTRQK